MAIFDIENLNIDINTIPDEVLNLAENYFAGTSRDAIFGSSYNYIIVLYQWYFIDKLEKSEIADLVHVAPNNVHNWLYNLRWNYSNDYTLNKQMYENECIRLSSILIEAKEIIKHIDFANIKRFNSILLYPRYRSMRKKTWQIKGINTKDEYIKLLYYFCELREDRLCSRELAVMFDLKIENMQERTAIFDLSLPHEKAIENKKARKTQNYTKTTNSGKRTQKKALAVSPTSGSRNEKIFREDLALVIDTYFPEEYYEVIIGLNNVGILNGKEIDIPIIIHNNQTDKYIKIAVEYNGEIYHPDDSTKIKLLDEKDWIYFPVVETSADLNHCNGDYIMARAHKVAANLRKIVLSGK